MKMLKGLLFAGLFLPALLTMNAQLNEVNRLPEISNARQQAEYRDSNTGFWISPEVSGGYSCRLNHSNFSFAEMTVTGGYRFNEYLRVGIGFGGRYYIDNSKVRYYSSAWSFPLFANIRGNIIPTEERDVVPYYSFDLGGSIRDGFLMRPTIGIRIGRNRSAMLVGISYVGQHLKSYGYNEEGYKIAKGKFASFISLRLGYEF